MSLEDIKNEMLTVADLCMKYSKELKIPEAEFYITKLSNTEIQHTKGKVQSRDGIISGIGIQVADGKKIGFSACSGFANDSIKNTLQQAYAIAKNRPEDPRFSGFVEENPPGKDGNLDSKIVNLTGEDILKQISDASKEAEKYDERVIGMTISATNIWGGHVIANTNGLTESSLNTVNYCFSDAVVIDKGERSVAFDILLGRTIQDVSKVVNNSVNMAMKHLVSKTLGESIIVPTKARLYGK